MPLVLSSLHPKGGVGKSTVALCLAEALNEDGSSVLVLDTDPQGTALSHYGARSEKPPHVESTPAVEEVEAAVRDAEEDVVVIDGSARMKGETGTIVALSDLVLIPVRASPADLWAVRSMVDLVKGQQERTGDPAAGFVLNSVKSGTRLGGDTADVLRQMDLPVLTTLHDRVAYAEALVSGQTPLTYRPSSKAASEVRDLLGTALAALNDHFQQ